MFSTTIYTQYKSNFYWTCTISKEFKQVIEADHYLTFSFLTLVLFLDKILLSKQLLLNKRLVNTHER